MLLQISFLSKEDTTVIAPRYMRIPPIKKHVLPLKDPLTPTLLHPKSLFTDTHALVLKLSKTLNQLKQLPMTLRHHHLKTFLHTLILIIQIKLKGSRPIDPAHSRLLRRLPPLPHQLLHHLLQPPDLALDLLAPLNHADHVCV